MIPDTTTNATPKDEELIISTFLLDDDVEEIEFIKPYLEKVCGVYLHCFTNIEEFLASFAYGVHLGIIDHRLHACIDGIEVGKEVLKKNRFAKLILYSGSPNPEVWRKAMNCGFIGGFDKNKNGVQQEVADFVSEQLTDLRSKIAEWNQQQQTAAYYMDKYKKYL